MQNNTHYSKQGHCFVTGVYWGFCILLVLLFCLLVCSYFLIKGPNKALEASRIKDADLEAARRLLGDRDSTANIGKAQEVESRRRMTALSAKVLGCFVTPLPDTRH